MVSPNKKTEHGNGQTRERYKRIAENVLSRKVGNQFTYYTHAGKYHDVDGRMRVEPEEVLEKHRVTPHCRIEDSHMGQPLESQKQDRDGYYRRPQNHNQRCSIVGPDEEGQPEPRHSGSAHCMYRDDEVQSGKD